MMNGLDKFYGGLTKAFVEIYLPSTNTYTDELGKSLSDLLMNRNDYQPLNVNLPPAALYVRDIHLGVFEILGSYESLLDAELYIRRFPFANTRVSRVRYLRYVIENHLNEIYILKERMKNYLKTIENLCAEGTRRKSVKQITQHLFTFNKDAFKDLVEERGAHVHVSRYDDTKLMSIDTMERLSTSNPDEEWSLYLYHYFELDYKRIRSEKAKEIATQNFKIKSILDEYFEKLYPAIFDKQDNLFMPN